MSRSIGKEMFTSFLQSAFKELRYLSQRVGTVPGPCPKKLHRSSMGLSVVFPLPSEMAIGSVSASMAPCYGQQFCSAERLLRFSLVPGFVACGACGRRVSCFYCSTPLKHVSSVQCDKRHYDCHYVNLPAVITGWVDDGDVWSVGRWQSKCHAWTGIRYFAGASEVLDVL